MNVERQLGFEDVSPEYAAFVEKFKPKKTTDDCYTPKPVYDAIASWVVKHYGLNGKTAFVRPFWPGADFTKFDYPEGCVVVDNPPFSMLADILRLYNRCGVDYFLFAPALTLFSNGKSDRTNFVVCGAQIEYENGAKVPTSFVTSLGKNIIEVCGDLYKAVEEANAKVTRALPKYDYPDDVATAATLQRISKRGGSLAVKRGEAMFTRRLDAQDKVKESGIFGGGFILSKDAARRRAEAEWLARQRDDDGKHYVWRLSDRERILQEALDTKKGHQK